MEGSGQKYTGQQVTELYKTQIFAAAREIGNVENWSDLGFSQRALWGQYNSTSNAGLYFRVVVSLELGFSLCECKNRTSPCRHSLALMLLTNRDDAVFTSYEVGSEPDFVKEKLLALQDLAKKAEGPRAKTPREIERHQRILETLDLVEDSLFNIVGRGLRYQIRTSQDLEINLRALDKTLRQANLIGLAARATEAANYAQLITRAISRTSKERADTNSMCLHIVRKLTELYSISQAYRNHEQMPLDWRIESRHLLGIEKSKAQVRKQEGVRDTWVIVDDPIVMESQTTAVLTYLVYGVHTHRFALLSERFPQGDSVLQLNKIGDSGECSLQFYPGVGSIRQAILPDYQEVMQTWDKRDVRKELLDYTKRTPCVLDGVPFTDFAQMLEDRKQYYQTNPLAPDYVALVGDLHFVLKDKYKDHQSDGKALFLVDQQGQALRCEQPFDANEPYLNHTAGKSFSAFVRVRHQGVVILCVVCDGFLYKLYGTEARHAHITKFAPQYEGMVSQALDGVTNCSMDLSKVDPELQPRIGELKMEADYSDSPNSLETRAALFYKTASAIFRHHRIKDIELLQGVIPD